MILRTRHLACLLLLLSSLGVASQGARAETAEFRGSYIEVLLMRHAATANTLAADAESERVLAEKAADVTALPAAGRASVSAAWMMRPGAAQTASVFARTGFPRA